MQKKRLRQETLCKEIKPNSGTLSIIHNDLHSPAANILVNLISAYERKITNTSLCALIKGPKGSGKTFLVRNTMKQIGICLLEFNNSSCRDLKNIKKILADAIKNFTVSQKDLTASVVFIDDIDENLECDIGFDKALKWVISQAKCPVVMTCKEFPKEIKLKGVKIIELETNILYLDLLYRQRDMDGLKITDIEIFFLFRYFNADLNYIFTIFKEMKQHGNKISLLLPGVIRSSTTMEIKNVESALNDFWERFGEVEILFTCSLFDISEWLEDLCLYDAALRDEFFFHKLCKNCYRCIDKIELKLKSEDSETDTSFNAAKRKIAFREFGVMGDISDYISYSSALKKGKKRRLFNDDF